jgi:hypothetical protein
MEKIVILVGLGEVGKTLMKNDRQASNLRPGYQSTRIVRRCRTGRRKHPGAASY